MASIRSGLCNFHNFLLQFLQSGFIPEGCPLYSLNGVLLQRDIIIYQVLLLTSPPWRVERHPWQCPSPSCYWGFLFTEWLLNRVCIEANNGEMVPNCLPRTRAFNIPGLRQNIQSLTGECEWGWPERAWLQRGCSEAEAAWRPSSARCFVCRGPRDPGPVSRQLVTHLSPLSATGDRITWRPNLSDSVFFFFSFLFLPFFSLAADGWQRD